MTGRQEHNDIIDAKTKTKLVGQPKIIGDYYYSLTDKTSATKRNYIDFVIEFIKYLKNNSYNINKLNEIKPSDIHRYLEDGIRYRYVNGNKIENSESIRCQKFFAISNFFEYLYDEGVVQANPCARVKPPRVNEEKEIIAMTPKEIKILKKNIINGVGGKRSITEHQKWVNRDLAIVMLGCSTGLRVTSITEINISDINFDENMITVREKGNKQRDIIVGDNTMQIIIDWIADREEMFPGIETDALFISRKRNRIAAKTIADMLAKYSVGIDKHITPHKMRSSCATNLYEKTGDIYLVQEVLGHKNIANTRRYAKISSERRAKAVAILDKL